MSKGLILKDVMNLIEFDPSDNSLQVYFMLGAMHGLVFRSFKGRVTKPDEIENLNRYKKCMVDRVFVAGDTINIRLNYESSCNIEGRYWFE